MVKYMKENGEMINHLAKVNINGKINDLVKVDINVLMVYDGIRKWSSYKKLNNVVIYKYLYFNYNRRT